MLKTSNFDIITSTSQTISLTTDYTYFSLPQNYSLDGEQNPEFDLDNPTESICKHLILLNENSGNITIRTSLGSFVLSFANPQVTLCYDINVGYWTQENVQWYVTTQMGNKLVGLGYSGTIILQGTVSLSANGDTLAIGGPEDNSTLGNTIGATWIFVRNGTSWSQQDKLVGIGGASGNIAQGISVSLSANGNTLAVGGYLDNSGIGATWIFVRNGTSWSQQGAKLVGVSGIGPNIYQGHSVSLSSDGNTLAIGGIADNLSTGATWIFIRNGTSWTQQGSKLVGNSGIGPDIYQGFSVSLSADGNTLAIGGPEDNSDIGATWIFVREGTSWSQQGAKLVGTGNTGNSYQGNSVSLSADGNTLAVGSPDDNTGIGATWIFTRSGNIWAQEAKIVGTGFAGTNIRQGRSVNLSATGKTLAIGGSVDNGGNGATWIFTKSNGLWSQQGEKIVGTGGGTSSDQLQGSSVALSSDGNILAIGGYGDDADIGATWVFS